MKLSILVSYYDTYDLTIKLLKELSIQLKDNVEVIVVDDGCHEERFDKFKEFTIIHLAKNKGMSNALNVALDNAKGEYIAFIDSDDMITMDYIDVLLDTIKTHKEQIITFNWFDINQNILTQEPTNYALWKAIYKKNIFPTFEKDRRYENDVPIYNKLMSMKLSTYHIDRVLYLYNSYRVGSLTWERLNKRSC